MERVSLLLIGAISVCISTQAASCPAITVSDMRGVARGAFPQQYELAEFEAAAKCSLMFRENPGIASLNERIRGNPVLPPLAERLPDEPLIVVPYDSIGTYGGILDVMSNSTESGTTDVLSIRHINLVRYSDDLQTIVPNVSKGWAWNDDHTQLTFTLRRGHKWSDGAPFTSADVKFWYDNLALDPNVRAKPKGYALVAGERMTVETPDPQTVVFKLPAPKPGLLIHFATSHAPGYQPKHFLGRFHPAVNPEADALAQSMGFENGYAVIAAYYGSSDWMDTPTPLLNSPDRVGKLPADVMPTLESHIYISDTTEGRHLVANPYFHQVDTAGNQLPYISEQNEVYINDNEVRLLKLINGEIDYKSQALQLADAPALLDGQERGNYRIDLSPEVTVGSFAFNVTSNDLEKRRVFADLRFRQAMSVAIDRGELNELGFFGLGIPQQYVGFVPLPEFIDPSWKRYMAQYDPDMAARLLDEIGLLDADGDGFRELPNGDKLVLTLQFTTKDIAGQVVEIVGEHWARVGIKSVVKEVVPEELWSLQSANKLDVMIRRKGEPIAITLGNSDLWVPPFDNYFGLRTGMLWAEWIESDGAVGVGPPDYVLQLIADINDFQSAEAGSAEFKRLGRQLVENMVSNLLFIGTVNAPAPIYHRNALKNFVPFKLHGTEYHRAYPYRPTQWYLADGG